MGSGAAKKPLLVRPLGNICRLLGLCDEHAEVRRWLQPALGRSRTLEVQAVGAEGKRRGPIMQATLHRLRTDDAIISAPVYGSTMARLHVNEALELGAGPLDARVGLTRVLSRARIVTPAGPVPGYRLAIPELCEPSSPEREPGGRVFRGGVIEVELHILSEQATVRGVLLDLSGRGMRIRSRNAASRVEPGQRVHLRCRLPEPVGEVCEIVEIMHLTPTAQACLEVDLGFVRPIVGLEELLRLGHVNLEVPEVSCAA